VEGGGDGGGGGGEGPAANVEGIVNHRGNPLHQKSRAGPRRPADENQDRQLRSRKRERLRQLVDRIGRIRVHLLIALLTRAARGVDQVLRAFEFGDEPVERRPFRRRRRVGLTCVLGAHCSFRSASAGASSASRTRERISKIEIIGRKRIKRKKRATKNPMVPT